MKKLCLFLLAVVLSFNAKAESENAFFAKVMKKTAEVFREAIENYKAKRDEFETKVRAEAKANGEELSEEEINARVDALLMEFYKAVEEAEHLEQDKAEAGNSVVE